MTPMVTIYFSRTFPYASLPLAPTSPRLPAAQPSYLTCLTSLSLTHSLMQSSSVSNLSIATPNALRPSPRPPSNSPLRPVKSNIKERGLSSVGSKNGLDRGLAELQVAGT
jgi:hypothetical protein